jgi:preprotein translocase subunit SecE
VPKAIKRKGARKKQNRIQRFFRETIGELRRVSWPTRQEATSLTIIVLIVIILMSSFLGLLDVIYARFFSFIFAS